jgi:hypothetical protein
MDNLVKKVNYSVVKHLKHSNPNRRSLMRFDVEVSPYVLGLLKNKYNINKRWQVMSDFVQEFDIITRRHFPSGDVNTIRDDSFKIKIKNQRTIYFNDGLSVTSSPVISFQFIKDQN